MLTFAAIIFAGTVSSSVTHSHGTFPQGGKGTIIATSVNVERTFPPVIPKRPLLSNALFAAQQAGDQEERQLCRVTTRFGTTFYTSLSQRACLSRPEALTKY
jgi:hypothetical protein